MNAGVTVTSRPGDTPGARARPPRQPDLFAAYPEVPGARPVDTSMAAADSVAEEAPRLRERVLEAVRAAGACGLTADEAAERLDLSPFTARPRFSELRETDLIQDSGRRRENASGRKAIVWVAT